MAQTGQETIIVTGPITEIGFMQEKTRQINATSQKLSRQGKEIVNIVESLPTSILGLKTQEIRIIWKIPDKPVSPLPQKAPTQSPAPATQAPAVQKQFENVSVTSENFDAIVDRIHIFLEDEEWERADYYCEQALNFNPRFGTLYLCKLMAELHVKNEDGLKLVSTPFDSKANCIKAGRYDPLLAEKLSSYNDYIRETRINREKNRKYEKAVSTMKSAKSESEFRTLVEDFSRLKGFKNADKLRQECLEKAETAQKDETYEIGVIKMSDSSIEMNEEALTYFESIIDWKDSRSKIEECKTIIAEKKKVEAEAEIEREIERKRQEELAEAERKRKAEEARIAAEKEKVKKKKTTILLSSATVLGLILLSFVLVCFKIIIPSKNYKAACQLADSGEYTQALSILEQMENYEKAKAKIPEIHYNIAVIAEKAKDIRKAALEYGKAGNYEDAHEKSLYYHQLLTGLISAGEEHTVCISADGTAIATEFRGYGKDGYEKCNVSNWKNIVAISAGEFNTVGVRSDGTVVATNPIELNHSQSNVTRWKNIIAVAAGHTHTVGLCKDGTVVATGDNDFGQCDVSGWKDIVAIAVGDFHTVGLRSNGTVVTTGSGVDGSCDVSDWRDIIAIDAGDKHTVGLRADGTVVATEYTGAYSDYEGQSDVSDWTDIVAIAAGWEHTVGLRADGTVVATGLNDDRQCQIGGWKNVIAIAAGAKHTVGLLEDGTVVAKGDDYGGKCNVEEWNSIMVPTIS